MHPSHPPARARRRHAALDALVWAAPLIVLGACVNPPTGQYRGGYQSFEAGDTSRNTLSNLGELTIQDQLGVESRYRADLRAVRTDTTTRTGDTTIDSTETLFQPSLEMVIAYATLQWIQGYEVRKFDQDTSLGDRNLTRTDVLQKLVWSPENLPELRAWVDARAATDDTTIDDTLVRSVFELEDLRGPFHTEYRLEMLDRTDELNGVERDTLEHIFRETYRDGHLDGRLTSTVSLFLNDRSRMDRLPGSGSGLPPDQRFPTAGLSVVDSSPQVAVLNANSALIDGDDSASAGINIGGLTSGGQLDWNIGVEFPEDLSVSLALLYTQQEVSPIFLAQYSFSVWTSEDNSFWTPAAQSTAFTYETAFRRFRINVPAASGRFFKLVCDQVSPLAPPVLVTELELFGSDSGTGNSSDTVERKDEIRSGNATFSWTPLDRLTLGADVYGRTTDRRIQDTVAQDETRFDLGLSGLWTPVDIVDVNLRFLERSIEDSVVADLNTQQIDGLVTVQPVETFDVTFRYTDLHEDRNGTDFRDNKVAGVLGSAQLLENLRADLGYERNVLDDFNNTRTVSRDIVTATAVAQLTRQIETSLTVRNDNASVTGLGADLLPNPSANQTQFFFVYQPSNQLTGEIRLTWRDDAAGSGLDQRYRVDWLPFPDGTVDVQFDYFYLQQRFEESGSTIYRALTRWNITPKAFFQFNYAIDVPEDGDRTSFLTLSLNVGV